MAGDTHVSNRVVQYFLVAGLDVNIGLEPGMPKYILNICSYSIIWFLKKHKVKHIFLLQVLQKQACACLSKYVKTYRHSTLIQ